MHPSALRNAERFFRLYGSRKIDRPLRLAEIGSQDVNGSLRQVCPPNIEYLGLDFVAGRGVDVVLDDPYHLPFADQSFDLVVSSSCLEHSEMFWLIWLEMLRVTHREGLIYINVPTNAAFHRYPVDCWRFYPDSGKALVTWGRKQGYGCSLLESYVSDQGTGGQSNDFVAVFARDEAAAALYPERITAHHSDFTNGHSDRSAEILRYEPDTEDHRKLPGARLRALRRSIKNRVRSWVGA